MKGKKTGGRKQGSRNKKTVAATVQEQAQTALATLLATLDDTMPPTMTPQLIQWLGNHWTHTTFLADWQALKPAERFTLYDRLYQYCQAKKSATNDTLTVANTIEDDLLALADDCNAENT